MNDLKNLGEKLTTTTKRVRRYLPVVFILLLVVVYGFVIYQIQSLNNAEPAPDATASQTTSAKVPRIDPKVIAQLKSLQDNSVTVKSLFDQARNNPFEESSSN